MTLEDFKAFALIGAMATALALSPFDPAVSATPEHPLAVGHVSVPAPRQGTLLHLRGMVGKGVAVMRLSSDRGCARLGLRLVAGDFGGMTNESWGEPVRLEIRSSSIVTQLMRGIEVISDEIRVSTDPADPMAEIVIHSGMQADTGFVLNPGTSPLANIFGLPGRPVPCSTLRTLTLGTEG